MVNMTSVCINFEFEHKATIRKNPNCDGFSHDWYVIARGSPGNNIEYFVEKVVFHLHPSYPFPRRAVREPPFIIRECGFAGFAMPIDIYLKTKEEPKKISIVYDLKLSLTENVHQMRKEEYFVKDPAPPYMELLIKGGGELIRTSKIKKTKKNDRILQAPKKQKTGEVRKYKKRKTSEVAPYIPSPKSIDFKEMELGQRPIKRLKVLLPRNRIEQPNQNISNRPYY